ncbi:MAG: hypothetical protein GX228_01030 [Firmicutes bacterium]|jgi:hypothetical protein|nr:hypothetical protein [Bacillota bacterium]NLL87497.1 hypothetical protein [Bacillota bacterium]
MNDNKIPTNEIGEMLDLVSEKVPGLIRDVMAAFYSEEAAANLGKAVGAFYKQLVESGFKPEDAMAMAKDYLNSLRSMMDDIKVKNG